MSESAREEHRINSNRRGAAKHRDREKRKKRERERDIARNQICRNKNQ